MTQPLATRTRIGPPQLASMVARAADRPRDWLNLLRFDANSRWYQRLVLEEAYEVWLLSWLPGQHTGFHDHGPSAGAFAAVLGCLSERAACDGRPSLITRTVSRGSVLSFGPNYVHEVRNDSAQPSVSIHAYSPPLTSMRRFDVAASGLLRTTAEQRSW
jgi:predicted metal-dependent enzyme (double-stranded beta helix superfamily)